MRYVRSVMKFTLSQGRTKPKSFGCSVRVHGRGLRSMNTSEKLLNPDYRDMVECLLREGVMKLREKKNG